MAIRCRGVVWRSSTLLYRRAAVSPVCRHESSSTRRLTPFTIGTWWHRCIITVHLEIWTGIRIVYLFRSRVVIQVGITVIRYRKALHTSLCTSVKLVTVFNCYYYSIYVFLCYVLIPPCVPSPYSLFVVNRYHAWVLLVLYSFCVYDKPLATNYDSTTYQLLFSWNPLPSRKVCSLLYHSSRVGLSKRPYSGLSVVG